MSNTRVPDQRGRAAKPWGLITHTPLVPFPGFSLASQHRRIPLDAPLRWRRYKRGDGLRLEQRSRDGSSSLLGAPASKELEYTEFPAAKNTVAQISTDPQLDIQSVSPEELWISPSSAFPSAQPFSSPARWQAPTRYADEASTSMRTSTCSVSERIPTYLLGSA